MQPICLYIFSALRDLTTSINALYLYFMITQKSRRPKTEHVCQYNGSQPSRIAVFIIGTQDCIFGRHNLVIHWRVDLNATGSECFDTIPVTCRSNYFLSYILHLPHGVDGWHLGL